VQEIKQMPYCGPSDIETLIPVQELAELTTESGDIPDHSLIAEIISKADAEIDSYAAVSYVIPFFPIPDIIRSLSLDMAIYHLYSRRSAVPLIRRTKYEDAIQFLQSVAAGKCKIVGAAAHEIPERSSQMAEIVGSERVFSRAGWGIY
jgi:phage gp36-like protein